MLVRAIALSLALLVGIGVIVPLATDSVEAGPKRKKKKQVKKYKKYSKKWWRQYRARMARKKAQRKRARALRLRQLRLARAAQAGLPKTSTPRPRSEKAKSTVVSAADTAPKGWNQAQSSPSELQFRVDDSAGSQVGIASISVVGPAGDSSTSVKGKSVGGVSTSALRRDVINKMIRENGWVVNDYQKEIGGRTVYVVAAQSQAKNGRVQSRMFYFTEVDGRIYNVATNSPVEQAERLAEESEKVLDSLQTRVRGTQRAATKD
ncbi:MAG: hypothetical protein IPK01_02820 [Acidobacteria bacterium]|nr:hypothetical protein [Acidobacteriota bacterium]